MKVVLDTKRGSAYNDSVASHYHFPARYLRPLSSAVGDWAVFRRPRDGGEGIAYFATGRIDRIEPDEVRPGYHYAFIRDYLPFPTQVPWKPDGAYAERTLREIADVTQVGVHLRGRSVRPLEGPDFAAIVDRGFRELDDPANERRWWTDGPYVPASTPVHVEDRERRLVDRAVRKAAFRKSVCEAYDDRCAVTRLRIINGGGRSEVQAAHIRPVANGGPDLVQNGLALSATAHWLFDRHLISVDPEYRLLVAHNRVPTELRGLLEPALTRLHLPADERLRPAETFMAHHRERFGGAA